MSKLIIVESPAKCDKIAHLLGNEYVVMASCGHIYELNKSFTKSFDATKPLEPQILYEKIETKKAIIQNLHKKKKEVQQIILATDMDREGESISFNIAKELHLNIQTCLRIVFSEITSTALHHAVANPTHLNIPFVQSQQTRMILDQLYGFLLSPVVSTAIEEKGYGLSVGRCQTPCLRLILEREIEYQNDPVKIVYGLTALLEISTPTPSIAIEVIRKEMTNVTEQHFEELRSMNQMKLFSFTTKPQTHKPPLPLITSTLQSGACQKFNMTPKQTMMSAQKLYENGFITYMRTDSYNLAAEFVQSAQVYIEQRWGSTYVGEHRHHQNGATSQDAHEAIRPVDINVQMPSSDKLDANCIKLYGWIYQQTLASLMSNCLTEQDEYLFHPVEHPDLIYYYHVIRTLFNGFKILQPQKEKETVSPTLTVDAIYNVLQYELRQDLGNQSKPYTISDVVKQLEKKGIGRPSTYAGILERIETRGYVEKNTWEQQQTVHLNSWILCMQTQELQSKIRDKTVGGNLTGCYKVTELGKKVVQFMMEKFANLVDYEFTKKLELDLDQIANGQLNYETIIQLFYQEIKSIVTDVKMAMALTHPHSSEGGGGVGSGISSKFNKIKAIVDCDTYMIGTMMVKNKKMLVKAYKDPSKKWTFLAMPENSKLKDLTADTVEVLFQYPKSLGTYAMKDVVLQKGKYGFYIKWGEQNVRIEPFLKSANLQVEELTLEHVISILQPQAVAVISSSTEMMDGTTSNIASNSNPNPISNSNPNPNPNILKILSPTISIRNGQYGHYIFIKGKTSEDKPTFHSLKPEITNFDEINETNYETFIVPKKKGNFKNFNKFNKGKSTK